MGRRPLPRRHGHGSRREFLRQRLIDSAALTAETEGGRQVRIGVVGGGFGTQFYWHEHPSCTVAAVTVLHADRRDRLRQTYRCDTAYASLEEILRGLDSLDSVAVFSGALDHFAHVSQCMKRGLHVICAVPAVMTLEQADRLHLCTQTACRRGIRRILIPGTRALPRQGQS